MSGLPIYREGQFALLVPLDVCMEHGYGTIFLTGKLDGWMDTVYVISEVLKQ